MQQQCTRARLQLRIFAAGDRAWTRRRSITGGYVYHGSAIPDLVGVFVYADFMTGNIFQYFDPGSGNIIRAQLAADLRVSAFGQANDGELYVLNLFPDGTIHRIVAD